VNTSIPTTTYVNNPSNSKAENNFCFDIFRFSVAFRNGERSEVRASGDWQEVRKA
jgi:hypothetical protein